MASRKDEDSWTWELSARAVDQFSELDAESRERIVEKLDDVVSSEWREPRDFLEPLTRSPFQKLRVGDLRIGCRVMDDDRVLRVESIRKREGAYSGDD